MQILLVEDDYMISEGVVSALKRHGFTASSVPTAQAAIDRLKTDKPDILVLDLGLPDMDGIDLLRKIRKQGYNLPVLILTARDGLANKITGLDTGADDYLTKPFEIGELFARLRVLERRIGSAHSAEVVIDGVFLNTAAHTLKVNGIETELSRREFMLLKALMESAGSVLTKDALEARLYSLGEETGSNTVEVYIHHLRKKLPQDFIKTVRGIGYSVKKPVGTKT
jgi:two-component system OmpR family response regulator